MSIAPSVTTKVYRLMVSAMMCRKQYQYDIIVCYGKSRVL